MSVEERYLAYLTVEGLEREEERPVGAGLQPLRLNAEEQQIMVLLVRVSFLMEASVYEMFLRPPSSLVANRRVSK